MTGQSLGLGADLSRLTSETTAEDIPEDWTWSKYLQLTPDVAAAVGESPEAALLHWRDWGRAERRPYKVPHLALTQPLFVIILGAILTVLNEAWRYRRMHPAFQQPDKPCAMAALQRLSRHCSCS